MNYKVKQEDLIGDIKDFPIEVVQAMVDEQVRQGNKPDVSFFQGHKQCGNLGVGFEWLRTKEGVFFWNEVIYKMNFDFFFEEYSYKKQEIMENYKVKETDLKGKLDGFPLELAQLAFDNAKNLYRDFEEEAPTDQELIKLIQDIGFTGLFVFTNTEEGHEFWEEISNGNLNAFQELKEGKSFKSLDASKQSDCEFSIKAESGMVKSTINGSGAHIAALIASAMKADPRIESVMRSAITLIHKN